MNEEKRKMKQLVIPPQLPINLVASKLWFFALPFVSFIKSYVVFLFFKKNFRDACFVINITVNEGVKYLLH